MTADEIKVLGDSEMETGQRMAIALGIVSIAFLVIIGSLVAATVPNLLAWVFLLAVVLGSAAVTGAMFWAWRRRNSIITLFTDYCFPAPAAPPATATAPAHVNTPQLSRGGEDARKIHGFSPATIMWVCDSLAQGASWTETALEKYTVPHMQPPTLFGKARGDTPYNRLFNSETGLFIRAGIIEGRTERFSGKLVIKMPLEMLQRIKELPPLDSARAE
jgi:hypothetical protein